LDDYAFEFLESLLVTFFNLEGYCDCITGFEIGIGCDLLVCESLVYDFDKVHFFNLFFVATWFSASARPEVAYFLGLQRYKEIYFFQTIFKKTSSIL